MNKVYSLIIRYLLIILLGLGNLYIIYLILTPLTTYVPYIILSLFSPTTLSDGFIYFGSSIIEIIPACVAGAAYYLLLILTLSTPNLPAKKYIKLIGISFGTFFIFNVLRILFLVSIRNSLQFDLIHKVFWYVISTIVVVVIWFFLIKKYKIKEYPFLSDLKYLVNLAKLSEKTKNPKRAK